MTTTQSRMEPAVCASAPPTHPLALALAGCWLLNEGAGATTHDAGGRHHDGTFCGAPTWSQGPFGRAVEFDGVDDWVTMGDCLDPGTDDVTLFVLVRYSAASQPDAWGGSHYGAIAGKGYLTAGRGYGLLVDASNRIGWQVRNGSSVCEIASDVALNDGLWHLAIGVWDRDSTTGVRLYIDGMLQTATADATAFDGIDLTGTRAFAIGSRQDETAGTWFWDFLGSVAMVVVWKRVLTEAEIRRLCVDPFEMFRPRRSVALLATSPGNVIQCAGFLAAVASLEGTLSHTGVRKLSGTTGGRSTLHAVLRVTSPESGDDLAPQAETDWRSGVLLHGASHTAFALGTVLTQGWFWVRRRGCTTVYRGASPAQADFSRILCVAEPNAQEIPLPAWLSHPPGSTHCYLVRRFDGCGRQEKTLAAAAMLRIRSDGQRVPARPNAIHSLRSERIDAASVRLVWFYCPLDQEIPPRQFNVYRGEADLDHPIGVVRFDGRRFYACHDLTLADAGDTVVVRAASTEGIEGLPSTCDVVRAVASAIEPPTILGAASF